MKDAPNSKIVKDTILEAATAALIVAAVSSPNSCGINGTSKKNSAHNS